MSADTAAVRLAIVGASPRGLAMGQVMEKHADCRIVGCADPNEGAQRRARERLGTEGITYAPSDADLFAKVDCDAVLIASGDPYHVDNTEVALRHGKDVFLEKPVAQTMDGLRRVVKAWKASDRVLMVGLELRQCALFQKMRELLDAGVIGRVILSQAFDNVSVGGRYFYHNQYRTMAHTRSLLLQKGTHTIDLMNWFADARPTRVFCMSGQNVFGLDESETKRCRDCDKRDSCRHVVRDLQLTMDYVEVKKVDDICVFARGSDLPDNSLVLVEYDNHTRAYYGECHFTPEYTREFTLIGDQGKMTGFYNNECEFKITVVNADAPLETQVYHPRPTIAGGHGGSDTAAMIEFGRRIRERDRADDEFREVIDGTAIAVAAADSEESGLPVAIPDLI